MPKSIISRAMSELARRKQARRTAEERAAHAASMGQSSWAGLTAEERSERQKRAWRTRRKNARTAAKKP